MLQEMIRHRAKTLRMLEMEPSNTPTSNTRINMRKFTKYLQNATELDIRFR